MKYLVLRALAALLLVCLGFTQAQIVTAAFMAAAAGARPYLDNVVNVKDYGAKCDGVTNDTAALIDAIAAMPAAGGTLVFQKSASPCMMDAATLYGLRISKTNFAIIGNGATLKVIDAALVVGSYNMLTFITATDGYISDLILDGNRAKRIVNLSSPAGAYSISILDHSARLLFKNVRAINSVSDGFTVGVSSTNKAVVAAYPTDITFEDCSSDNAVRNGLSLITSVRANVIGGRYINSRGSPPEDGIDVEPDDGSFIYGNLNPTFRGIVLSGNEGYGISFGGAAGSPNAQIVIDGLGGNGNAHGFLNLGQVNDAKVHNLNIGAHASATRGVIDIGTMAINVHIENLNMVSISANSSSNSGIYVHSLAVGPITLENISMTDMSCRALWAESAISANNVKLRNIRYAGEPIQLSRAWRHSLRNVTVDGKDKRVFP